MGRLLRRVCWLAVLAGAGAAAYTLWQRRRVAAQRAEPVWPPIISPEPIPQPFTVVPAAPTAADRDGGGGGSARWVAPTNGQCPEGYSVKVNDTSGIFHLPGGRFYDRTAPDRCYASTDDAAADGYRPSKA